MIIKDWKRVAKAAYSVWFAIAALALLHASDLIYVVFGIDTNPKAWTWILTWFLVAVIVSRFIPQPEKGRVKRRACVILFILIVCGAAWPAMAHTCPHEGVDDETKLTVDLVKTWEGERKSGEWHVGYLDRIAEPDLPTACYGHTETAVVGKLYSQAECDTLLARDLMTYRDGVRRGFTSETKTARLTPHRGAAYSSFTYNIGIRAATKSTSLRRLNRGDIRGACKAMTWFNRSGGRVVRGLVNRRKSEYDYCIRGLS